MGTSAIAMKADDVRIISRQGTKIVTGVDTHNSKDVELASTYGIDLIAGNDDSDLQPMVKGRNLVEFLVKIVDNLNSLNSVVDQLSNVVNLINSGLMGHTHPVAPDPTQGMTPAAIPSITYVGSAGIAAGISNLVRVKQSLVTARVNTMGLEANYLGPGGQATLGAPNSILSNFNRTN